MKKYANIIAGAASCGVWLVASGCAPVTRYAITNETVVDSRAVGDPEDVIDRAKAEIIARGRNMGLVLRESAPNRIVLTEADVAGPLSAHRAAAAAADGISDNRSAVATAEFSHGSGIIRYRYWVRLVGATPKNTTPAHEARMAAAILAIREVFEKPLETNMDHELAPR